MAFAETDIIIWIVYARTSWLHSNDDKLFYLLIIIIAEDSSAIATIYVNSSTYTYFIDTIVIEICHYVHFICVEKKFYFILL